MREQITEGGWVWYARRVISIVGRKLTEEETSFLMREGYLKSKTPEDIAVAFREA